MKTSSLKTLRRHAPASLTVAIAAAALAFPGDASAQTLGSPQVGSDQDPVTLNSGTDSASIELGQLFSTSEVSGQIVLLSSNAGDIYIEMLDEAAPKTVPAFLAYVTAGDYNDSIIHRAMPGFVLQGGGFTKAIPPAETPNNGTLVNEFSLSNTRGTLSIAKLGGDPDSGSNQWFINLDDNSENLDNQNGGFTVFARVIGDGMTVADSIAELETIDQGGAFTDLPIVSEPPENEAFRPEDLVSFSSVRTVDSIGESGYLTVSADNGGSGNYNASISGSALIINGTNAGPWNETLTISATDPYGTVVSREVMINAMASDGGDPDPDTGGDGGDTDTDGDMIDGGTSDIDLGGGGTDTPIIPGDQGGGDSSLGDGDGVFDLAVGVAGGWEFTNWFGFYYADTAPWIYHERHGWLYVQNEGGGAGWLWHPFFKWIYTTPELYGWFYRADNGAWTWFESSDSSALLFYDANEDFWFEYFPPGS